MKKTLYIVILVLLTGSLEAQKLSIIDALHLNEQLDFKTRKPIRIVEKNTSYNNNDKETHDKIIKTFDKAGMLKNYEFYDDNDILIAKATYSNDTVHKIKMSQIVELWDKNGSSKQTSSYTYDNNYFLKEATDFDDIGIIIRKISFVCNDRGHPIKLSLFDGKGKLFVKEKATYFYNTNIVKVTIETPDGQILSDNESSKISLKNESNYPDMDEAYNNSGDKIRWKGKGFFDKNMIYEREYVYDNFGNWIESKIFLMSIQKDGQPLKKIRSIISREFIYK